MRSSSAGLRTSMDIDTPDWPAGASLSVNRITHRLFLQAT